MTNNNPESNDLEPKIAVTSVSFGKSAVLWEELLRVFPNSVFNDNSLRLSGKG
ncbi:uncharacterized protein METZ01_LOCUS316316, partial [marine metagenome]